MQNRKLADRMDLRGAIELDAAFERVRRPPSWSYAQADALHLSQWTPEIEKLIEQLKKVSKVRMRVWLQKLKEQVLVCAGIHAWPNFGPDLPSLMPDQQPCVETKPQHARTPIAGAAACAGGAGTPVQQQASRWSSAYASALSHLQAS